MKIVQVGGGTTGWLSALGITKYIPDVDFTIIENDNPISVGEATFPTLKTYHTLMDINEQKFMQASNSTFKYAVRFDNFHEHGHTYFHSFLRSYSSYDFWDYFLKENKIPVGAHPDLPIHSDGGEYYHLGGYAYHLESDRYVEFIKTQITTKITHIQDTVSEIKINENGIDYIKINDDYIYADLFIDCSGFNNVLIGKLQSDWISIQDSLPNNTAIVYRRKYNNVKEEMCPYTRATGLKNGWMWTIPLWDKKSHGYVFSDSYTSINDAEIEFRQTLGLKDTDECKVIKFKNGYLDRSWIKNCVAIGLSSCFIEPLESTGIALSINQIERLLTIFDKGYIKQVDKDVFNDLNIIDTLRIKSFIRNHFIYTVREDSEYWKDWKYNQTFNKDELELYKFAQTGLTKVKESQSIFFPNSAFQYISDMHKASDKFNSFVKKHSLHNPKVAQITLPPEGSAELKEKQTLEHIKAEVKLAPNHYDFVKKYIGQGNIFYPSHEISANHYDFVKKNMGA
jgi:tryptophan halogenase